MMSWGQFPSYNMLAKYAAPRGWTGQWPPPAPPHQQPPMPEGMNMDPRRWQSGQWHFNTAFNFGAPAQAEWAPHPAWGGPGAADFNPYKRVAKRGDAEYYRQPLSANPLGLTDMIPAEELEKQKQPEESVALRTPWFWAPNELVAEDAPPAEGEQPSQRPHQHNHHRHRSNSEHTRAPDQWASSQQKAPSRAGGRASGEEGPNNANGHRAPPSSASAAVSSFAQYGDQQQPQQQRGYGPDLERRHSGDMNGSSASTQARSHTLDSLPAWSSHSDLKPTFSPKIVRTPESYLSSASAAAAAAAATSSSKDSRRASEEDSTPKPSRRHSSREKSSLSHSTSRRSSKEGRSRDSPPTRKHRHRESSSSDESPPPGPRTHGRIYGPPTPTSARTKSDGTTSSTQPSLSSLSGSMGSLSVSDSTAPTSTTSQNFLQQPFFSDEPVDLLSPLLVPAVPPRTPERSERSGKELSRSQTYPNFPSSGHTSPFPPIPEEPHSSTSSTGGRLSRTPSSKTPKRSPSHHSPRTPKNLGRSRTYPNVSDVSPVIPPRPETYSPPRYPSTFNNPLPTPPKEISTASTSVASQSYHTPTRTSSQDRYSADTHSRAQSYPSAHPSSFASQAQHMSSASTAAQQQQQQQQHQHQHYQPQPQPQPPVTKRYGYWNRRGDHLVIINAPKYATSTDDQKDRHYIVYVPREQANPDDLAGYPAPTAGWMDHRGRTIKYDPTTPELPESLPRRGEPPIRPYQSFLQYITV